MKRLFIFIISIFMSIILLSSCTATNFTETNKSTEKESEEFMSDTVETKESVENSSDTEEAQTTEKPTRYDDIIDSNDLEYIYHVVIEEKYSSVYNYINQVKRSKSVEKPKELLQESIVINDVKHSLTYTGSVYYTLNDITLDSYYMDGDKNATVRLCNGQIVFLSYEQMKIDISPSATPEEVLPLLKLEINKLFDVSKYEYLKMPKNKDKDKFGSYEFRFYNAVDGVIIDALAIVVQDTGVLGTIGMSQRICERDTLNINGELEHQAIELKLKETFGENYFSYNIHDEYSKVLNIYGDELYITYRIAPYIDEGNGAFCPGLHDVMIPLDMISNN